MKYNVDTTFVSYSEQQLVYDVLCRFIDEELDLFSYADPIVQLIELPTSSFVLSSLYHFNSLYHAEKLFFFDSISLFPEDNAEFESLNRPEVYSSLYSTIVEEYTTDLLSLHEADLYIYENLED